MARAPARGFHEIAAAMSAAQRSGVRIDGREGGRRVDGAAGSAGAPGTPSRPPATARSRRACRIRNAYTGVAVAALAVSGLWMLAQPVPPLSPAWIGFALFTLGAVFGLRTSADSAARLLADMLRLNRFLADQNTDLAEQNYLLLRKLGQHQDK